VDGKRKSNMDKTIKQFQISDVIAELGIPANSKYLGYAVHRPDSDEFLVEYSEKNGAEKWLWAKTPQLAHIYQDYKKALKHSAAYEKAPTLVGLVFDIGDQLFFASSTEAR